jgi:Family of unknown function (DUF5906)/RepB DNA-primase from phage plasmid
MSDNVEKGSPGAGTNTGAQGQKTTVNLALGGEVIPEGGGAGEREVLSDTGASLDFLEHWCPGGPWVLTSIVPDGRTTTETFTAQSLRQMHDWIDRRQGVQNIYFTVNRTSNAMEVKPKKSHIVAALALHVDVDPRAGEPLDAERRRALDLLQRYAPPPTVIIDSGGGLQGFWKLDAPAELAGDPLPVEDRNRHIEAALQADACHNIDRIMRLPGTVNIPNKKKLARGRKAALARVVEVDWSRRYRLEDFPRAAAVAADGSSAASVELPRDLPRVENLEVLPAAVTARTKMLIVNGGDPDDPGRHKSRSECLWAVLCEMVRAGCDDATIAAIILDPDYGISGHVLEQPRPRQYAERQIEKARDAAVDPWLARLNERFTVLGNQNDKCRILEFVRQPTGVRGETRERVSLQSFEDFRNRYMNQKVVTGQDKDGNDIKVPAGKWWLEHAQRRQFHSLVFAPRDGEVVGPEGGDPEDLQLNLWRGFSIAPALGDWSLMRAHIRDILAGGDEVSDSYIHRWMAWTVQNPDQPAEVALAFRGEMGTGKGVFGRLMARLFGQHGLHTGGTELISGRFNKHLADCCLLFADEILWDGDRKAEARMKVYLTEETIMIEGKGVDATSWPNMLHVIISSNSQWVVPAGPHERRYAVFDVSSAQKQNEAYFAKLYRQMDQGGLAAMLHDLLAMELGDWHPRRDRPDTAALADQKSRGLDPVDAEFLDMLRAGALSSKIPPDPRGTDERPFVATDALADLIREKTRAVVTWNDVARAMERIGAVKNRKRRPSGYVLPTLKKAREAWNAHPDLPRQEWDDAEDWPKGPF